MKTIISVLQCGRLSETLASSVDVRSTDGLTQELALCLKQLIKCLKSKVYASPKLNIDNLRAVLKSLPKAVKAVQGREIEVELTAAV